MNSCQVVASEEGIKPATFQVWLADHHMAL